APVLKREIAGCQFFIGARTHATIAAYSSLVPTLVVGYSVKSRGIARDLFGGEQGLVLPVQELTGAGLIRAFEDLRAREGGLRAILAEKIPGYRERALLNAAEMLRCIG
ncbi:MAG: polysaccharide pyruvyl transferase family protein, partial [Lachnospiraceae bacterium]|nr:polysaccharide pyruvyl transferase family protein [Lachnospiraceae bacterium]